MMGAIPIFLPFAFLLIWLAVVGYVLYLATRLVSAVEDIAKAVVHD